jgi:hypothetical protein
VPYAGQATRLGYVHLQKGATVEERLEGKKAFEAYTRSHGVTIKLTMQTMGISMSTNGLIVAEWPRKA